METGRGDATACLLDIRSRRGCDSVETGARLRYGDPTGTHAGNCARAHSLRGMPADLARALELFAVASAKAPAEPSWRDLAGLCLLHQGRFEEALVKFDEAIALAAHDPQSASISHSNAGGLRLRLGRHAAAADHFRPGPRGDRNRRVVAASSPRRRRVVAATRPRTYARQARRYGRTPPTASHA